MRGLFLCVGLLATAAAAQDVEDAAHRADRLETQRLNQRSPNGYAPARGAQPDSQRAYLRAQEEYERRLDAWRRRVAACESGDYGACQ